jgi:hypothetical protein
MPDSGKIESKVHCIVALADKLTCHR